MINKLEQLVEQAKLGETSILAVAAAEDEDVLQSVKDAIENKIIKPILIGNEEKIRKIANEIELNLEGIKIVNSNSIEYSAEIAVKLITNKEADFLMKGLIDTSILLKAVLNKDYGLRTDSLLSHVMIYEFPTYHKLLCVTDAAMNINPNYEQKVKILKNAIEAYKGLGIEEIKVGCIAAKEKVNPKMPATIDADLLAKACLKGEFGENVIVEGPVALDIAMSKHASMAKGYNSKISGEVDILLLPYIEVGNALGKSLTYMANAKSAGVIMGAKAPIVLTSRSETADSKLYSIAYGASMINKS